MAYLFCFFISKESFEPLLSESSLLVRILHELKGVWHGNIVLTLASFEDSVLLFYERNFKFLLKALLLLFGTLLL